MFSETVTKSEHQLASRHCASVERRTVSPKLELWGRLRSVVGESGDLVLIQRNCCSWATSVHFCELIET